jgi:hypothetical protein
MSFLHELFMLEQILRAIWIPPPLTLFRYCMYLFIGVFSIFIWLHARRLTKSCSFLHSRHCSSFLDAVIGYTTLLRNSMPELSFWPCNIFKLYSKSVWTRRSYLLAPSLFGVTKPIVIYCIYYLPLLAQSKWRYYFLKIWIILTLLCGVNLMYFYNSGVSCIKT